MNESTGKIFSAITSIMAEVEAIAKNKNNASQGFKFRGIDDVYNSIHPLLAKYKVFTVPEVVTKESSVEQTAKGNNLYYEKLMIRYTFLTDDGSSFRATVLGVGMDSGDKAANKAMAIAHKYVLLQVFCIPTEDMIDPDSETPPETCCQTVNGAPKRPDNSRPPTTRPAVGSSQGAATASEVPPLPWEDKNPPTTGAVNQALKVIDTPEVRKLVALVKSKKIDSTTWVNWLKVNYGVDGVSKILANKFQEIFDIVMKTPEKITGKVA